MFASGGHRVRRALACFFTDVETIVSCCVVFSRHGIFQDDGFNASHDSLRRHSIPPSSNLQLCKGRESTPWTQTPSAPVIGTALAAVICLSDGLAHTSQSGPTATPSLAAGRPRTWQPGVCSA